MSVELLTIASTVGKVIFPEIAKKLITKINSELNPTDLEIALKAGIKCAEAWDTTQPYNRHLFYHCEPKLARELIEQFFKNTGVQAELQKPLKDKTVPDIEILIAIFKNGIPLNHNLKFPDNSIDNWLKKFIDSYFEQTNTYLKFQIAKLDYFKQLANYFDHVEFVGLKVKGQEDEKSAKLPQIFVMPYVVKEIEIKETSFLKSLISFGQDETVNQQRQRELLREQQIALLHQNSGNKFSAHQLLKQSTSHKFVLLGEPGVGKTTLMSYFAVMVCENQTEKLGLPIDIELIPILIRIRDLARYSEVNILEYIRHFANSIHVKNLPQGFFEYWLEQGKSLILLDGLDEIANPEERFGFVKKIESFLGQYSQNIAIITSRPAGYNREFFRTEEFPHYSLKKFDDSQIKLFIKQWYESRCQDIDEAEHRQQTLMKALEEQKRIKLLARNPLLLTIIALINRYEAHLPKQRHKLYKQAVDTLLINWDKGKRINSWNMEYIRWDDIEALMQRIGYWIHTQGKTGDKEGGTLIDKDELVTQLSEYITEFDYQKQIPKHRAKAEAIRFINHIRERSGLLNEQGQDRYAFVHKTFQEYLTSQEIRIRQEESFEVVLEHIREHLHNSHWREVLLLLVAQQKRNNPKKVIEEIFKQDTPYEQWLHRNLFFVSSCLAEDIELSDAHLIKDILDKLVKLEVSDYQKVGYKIKSQVFQNICSLSETRFHSQVWQILQESADLIDKVRLQEYQLVLGKKEEALAELLFLLQDESVEVRLSAVTVLGRWSNTSEKVVEALLSRLHDENEKVRLLAVRSLGNLDNTSEKVVEALLSLLQDQSEIVRLLAVRSLNRWGKISENAEKVLLLQLQDKSDKVRSSAARLLGNLDNISQKAVETLLSLLHDESERVRTSISGALGNLSNVSEKVIEALLSQFHDESEIVRTS
ncbi:NACHT domain-containing protein, partial [Nostoc sp. CALU 1950]|uniref:NACHT domain-containing protein n=1 Tax=Nostoc sp. CALU 1950 TaxID=3104321 RepID=UPI003EBDC577